MRVSVCIPTYNQAHYLEKAIKSAVEQSLKPFEIIVSNDCSTDSTKEVLQKLSSEIPYLKVINQPVNLGIAKNTNNCLQAATGDYVVRLDSDDYLAATYCETLVALLEKHQAAGYAHGNVKEVDQADNIINDRTLYRKQEFQSSDEALLAAAKGYRVAANIIMFRNTALKSVNYITGRPDYVEDYHLSADLAVHGWGNVFSNQFLSYYRVWVDSGKVRQRRKMMELTGLYRVFTEVLEPAYRAKSIKTEVLKQSRENLACNQSDCLGWGVYSEAERKELTEAILKLSSSSKVKACIWLHTKGYGKVMGSIAGVKKSLKGFVKKVVNPS